MDEVEEQKEKLRRVKSMKTKEKGSVRRGWNKAIKEKVMVTIKIKKFQNNSEII